MKQFDHLKESKYASINIGKGGKEGKRKKEEFVAKYIEELENKIQEQESEVLLMKQSQEEMEEKVKERFDDLRSTKKKYKEMCRVLKRENESLRERGSETKQIRHEFMINIEKTLLLEAEINQKEETEKRLIKNNKQLKSRIEILNTDKNKQKSTIKKLEKEITTLKSQVDDEEYEINGSLSSGHRSKKNLENENKRLKNQISTLSDELEVIRIKSEQTERLEFNLKKIKEDFRKYKEETKLSQEIYMIGNENNSQKHSSSNNNNNNKNNKNSFVHLERTKFENMITGIENEVMKVKDCRSMLIVSLNEISLMEQIMNTSVEKIMKKIRISTNKNKLYYLSMIKKLEKKLKEKDDLLRTYKDEEDLRNLLDDSDDLGGKKPFWKLC